MTLLSLLNRSNCELNMINLNKQIKESINVSCKYIENPFELLRQSFLKILGRF